MEKIERWRKVLSNYCSKAFKKIRIKDKKLKPINVNLSRLIDKRNNLARIGCSCGKRFNHQYKVQEHQPKHTSIKLDCKDCGKQFLRIDSLKLHMSKHRSIQNFTCNKCEIRCKIDSDLQAHKILKHTSTGSKHTLKCYECG